MKPYCSIIIIFSVLIGKKVKSIFDPSKGGNGMRLKNAKSTFQKITIMSKAKNMEPNEFETAYAPDRPEIVYCEKCYQQEVY